MNGQRPQEITATHLRRKAVVYVRQSTERQVQNNKGSTEYQRSQASYARGWGWLESNIEIVDEDLGRTARTPLGRNGYQRTIDDIQANLVGAVLVYSISRLGRSLAEGVLLLDTMRRHNVLLVIDGKVYNCREKSGLLMAQFSALVAEHENRDRGDASWKGMTTNASNGVAVSGPPSGYVRGPKGTWRLDPDEKVRSVITTVFQAFFRERTLHRTVVALNEDGVLLPRRYCGALLRWEKPQIGTVGFMLRHPAYKGDYTFGRRVHDPALGFGATGKPRTRKALPEEVIVCTGHHDPYVSQKEWDEIQAILRIYAPLKHRRNLCPGSALLQGILVCARHPSRAMQPRYTRRANGKQKHHYLCEGDYAIGGEKCGGFAGWLVDPAVAAEAHTRLSPPTLDRIENAFRKAQVEERNEGRNHESELYRAKQEVSKLEDRVILTDASNTHVLRVLNSKLNEAEQEVTRLEREVNKRAQRTIFDEKAFAELKALCGDFEALWAASTTTNSDRKEILRTLIRNVVVERYDREGIALRIIWADATPDTTIEVKRSRYARRLMGQLRASGMTCREITTKLNELGLRTEKNRPWCEETVAAYLRKIDGKATAREGLDPETASA